MDRLGCGLIDGESCFVEVLRTSFSMKNLTICSMDFVKSQIFTIFAMFFYMPNVMSHRFYTIRLCCSRAILRISLLLMALACYALSMAAWTPIIRQFSPQDYAAGTQN